MPCKSRELLMSTSVPEFVLPSTTQVSVKNKFPAVVLLKVIKSRNILVLSPNAPAVEELLVEPWSVAVTRSDEPKLVSEPHDPLAKLLVAVPPTVNVPPQLLKLLEVPPKGVPLRETAADCPGIPNCEILSRVMKLASRLVVDNTKPVVTSIVCRKAPGRSQGVRDKRVM